MYVLPVGSVVYLKNGTIKIVVLGNSPLDDGKYYDYVGGEYPIGLKPDQVYFFNEDNIEEVLFEGYRDETCERYLNAIEHWQGELKIPKANVEEEAKHQVNEVVEKVQEQNTSSSKTALDDLFN